MTSREQWSPFTHSERTELNYAVRDAVASARRRLNKLGIRPMCINALRRYSYDTPITLEKLNELSDELVNETLYHEGYFTGTHVKKGRTKTR